MSKNFQTAIKALVIFGILLLIGNRLDTSVVGSITPIEALIFFVFSCFLVWLPGCALILLIPKCKKELDAGFQLALMVVGVGLIGYSTFIAWFFGELSGRVFSSLIIVSSLFSC